MKKFLVKWLAVHSVVLEAENEDEAINKVRTNNFLIQNQVKYYLEEQDIKELNR